MRIISILIPLLFILSSCEQQCKYPIYFQVSYVEPHTTIDIDLDSGKVTRTNEFQDGFYMEYKKRYEIIDSYCSSNKLITVRTKLNSNSDTVFIINPAKVRGCFIGANSRGKMRVFYDYYDGGLREYSLED